MTDEPQRHRIQVACPECGNRQTEPALVISTQCRSCLNHFEVRDGKGVARTRSIIRFKSSPADDPVEPPPPPRPAFKLSKPEPSPPPLIMRLLSRRRPPREVLCFQCAHRFNAIAEAQSSQCPKCGGYVSLIDYDIDELWNRRIQTRGNVVIRKNGSVSGTSVRCHHLTVLGELSSSVDCSGDLIIRSSGRISGTIHCRHLRIEKSSKVEFLHPVHAAVATIDGDVRGQIFCDGPVTLEKRSRFQGLVRTTSLTVKPGAVQSGTVEMINPEESPSPL